MKKMNGKLIFVLLLASFVSLAGCKKEYVHVGENWDALQKLKAPEKTFGVTVKGADSAKVGDELRYTVTSEKAGKLWVVQVDSEDNLALLYPQNSSQPNDLQAGETLTIPPEDSSLTLEAADPRGVSVIAFVVTTGDASIADVLSEGQSMEKAIHLVEESPSWGFAKKVVDIK